MNVRLTLSLLTLSSVLIATTGCNNNKSITPEQAGEVEILEYCSGDDYKSDKDHFRASATGESMSRETAKKMARSNAESRLARSISAVTTTAQLPEGRRVHGIPMGNSSRNRFVEYDFGEEVPMPPAENVPREGAILSQYVHICLFRQRAWYDDVGAFLNSKPLSDARRTTALCDFNPFGPVVD